VGLRRAEKTLRASAAAERFSASISLFIDGRLYLLSPLETSRGTGFSCVRREHHLSLPRSSRNLCRTRSSVVAYISQTHGEFESVAMDMARLHTGAIQGLASNPSQ